MSTDHELADTAAPLDALLIDAALGVRRRFIPDISTARWALGLARRPRTTARRLRELGTEAAMITAGASTLAPDRRDRRFQDVAWRDNPFLRRTMQLHLAAARTASQLVDDAQLEWRDEERTRFLVDNLTEALSPSNLPLINPASAKAVIDTAGLSLVRGGTNLIKDLSAAPRVPEMVDSSAFQVGKNIAATPGSVVLRTEVLELIQYRPQTDEVYDLPVLIVPPTINKFYAIDMAPDRSLIEFQVRQGRQVFVISWRNPDVRHAKWNFETYVSSIIEALEAVEQITGAERTVLGGICSGGILASITAAYLAATNQQDRLAALVLAVTVIDNNQAGTMAAISTRQLAEAAKAMSRRKGYLDGRSLAEVFAWLRPGDLIWNYWVNNYLVGKKPPAFDILFWNADTTRMTAGLHADFVDLALEDALAEPGGLTLFGLPIDLGAVEVDSYIVAGIADHITPWMSCYSTTHLLGGTSRFVLSTSGHIAALVNPPSNPKASFYTNPDNPDAADEWLKGAETTKGTWWIDLDSWLVDIDDTKRPAPEELGATPSLPPLDDAPGTYVYDA